MPDPAPRLDEATLLQDLRQRVFAPSERPPHVGLEIELLAFRGIQSASLRDVLDACQPLLERGDLVEVTPPGMPRCFTAGASRLTFEPGGQLELISPPRPSATRALQDIEQLEALLDGVLTGRGIRRACHGVNPWQDEDEIDLQTPEPRYRAMQTYFNQVGPDGVRMMRLCCALQINVDSGRDAEVARRWRLANLMSPVLVGMFANSPMAGGKLTGWKSSRAAIWQGVDPGRTGLFVGDDGPRDYLDFALGANVLLRRTTGEYRPGVPGFSFRHWMQEGDAVGFPTLDDWKYHLTTLFPQVRPRGFLELRAMDTPPVRWRAVPVAVTTALLLDEGAREESIAALEPYQGALSELATASARDGLAHPTVERLARALMAHALDAFPRLGDDWISPAVVADVEAYNARYTACSRCPADVLLDLQARGQDAAAPIGSRVVEAWETDRWEA